MHMPTSSRSTVEQHLATIVQALAFSYRALRHRRPPRSRHTHRSRRHGTHRTLTWALAWREARRAAGRVTPGICNIPTLAGHSSQPPLIRTSILQQPPSPATTPHGAHAGQQFNAYALYPHKAKLELQGDLDAIGAQLDGGGVGAEATARALQALAIWKHNYYAIPASGRWRPPQGSICISCSSRKMVSTWSRSIVAPPVDAADADAALWPVLQRHGWNCP